MHFGDPAVEVWNVFTGHDIHRIYLLEECVRKHINKTFININQTNIIDDHFRQHGGSNVTYLTGIMQEILPDVINKIILEINNGLITFLLKFVKLKLLCI
jgi:hypothetical protein